MKKEKMIKVDTCLGELDIMVVKDEGHYPEYGTTDDGDLITMGMNTTECFVAWDLNDKHIVVQEACVHDIPLRVREAAMVIKKYNEML